jgi:predicted ribosomally synthesized peptide with nif11-like leader
MSQSEIERFVADLKTNAALRAGAEKTPVGIPPATTVESLVSFATSKGYGFTAEEVAVAQAKADGKQLSDVELDSINGAGDDAFETIDPVDVTLAHLINIYRPIGADTIGSPHENATDDLRKGDKPTFVQSPWLQEDDA